MPVRRAPRGHEGQLIPSCLRRARRSESRQTRQNHEIGCQARLAVREEAVVGVRPDGVMFSSCGFREFGSGPGRIRTCDTRPRKPLLYPLSYRPAHKREPPRDVTVTPAALQWTVGAIEIAHPTYKLRRTRYVRGDLGHPWQPRGTRSRPWRRT